MKPKVAVLGTGIMGAPMAQNLLESGGFEVSVWNRTPARAAPLAAAGAEVARSPGVAASGARYVLTMLSDGDAVGAVMDWVPLAANMIWLQMSTIGIAATRRFAAAAAAHGVTFVDAPVLGTRQPAEQGTLTVLASGPDEARAACEPVFAAIGRRTLWVGPAGAGSRLKLVANSWIVGLLGVLAESVALAEALEIDPRWFFEAISGGPLDAGYAHLKGQAMLERSFEPAFPLRLALKDARLIAAAAAGNDLEVPVADAVARRLEEAFQAGYGDADMAAIFTAASRRRG